MKKLLVVFVLLMVSACGDPAMFTEGGYLISIAVAPQTLESPTQFIATGTYSNGAQRDITQYVTWASSKPEVAAISTTGVAIAVSPGTTVIMAAKGSIYGSCDLTVN